MSNRTPVEVFPPGEFIRDELEARGWTQGDLAQIMGRPESAINLIINDKRGVTPETATELAGAFDTSPEFWLNLENAYKLSKVVVPFSEIRQRASLFEASPVKEMEKRGWIKAGDSIETLKAELAAFYAGIDVAAFKIAARASTEQGPVTPEQLAWCVRALQLASKIRARPYQPSKIAECKKSLRSLAALPEGVARVPEMLAEFGIRFVVVEHLQGTKIDGAALWLGDGWEKPVVAISARYDRIDSFWHTVCHEVSHIDHKDSIALIDVDLCGEWKPDESILEIENRANREGADMLIPSEKLDSFIVRKRPYFSKIGIIQFANANKIHPGIVAGQLHHRLGAHKTNVEMLVKIRDILTARAVTDGWGVRIAK